MPFFFEAMFLLVKKPWAIPNPFFNLHFLSRSSFKWWISIMMLSHERIELVLKTKGQLSDNYSSYHHVHVKIRNATIYNNQLLSIDGHSWSKKFCSISTKKPWNFMPFTYHQLPFGQLRFGQRFSPSPLAGDTGPAKRVTHGAFSKVLKFTLPGTSWTKDCWKNWGFSAGNKHFGASRSFRK